MAEQGKLQTVVAYGDSWTYGSVADGWYEAREHDMDRERIHGSWVLQLRRWLQSIDPTMAVHNQGQGGWTSLQGLEQFDSKVEQLQPQLLLLNFGINDWKQPVPLEEYKYAMETMIDRAKQQGCRVILWTSGPISAMSEEHYDWKEPREDGHTLYRFSEVNETIRGLASRYDLILVEVEQAVYSRWLQGEKLSEWFYDAIHFTQPGHDVIFSEMKDALIKHGLLTS